MKRRKNSQLILRQLALLGFAFFSVLTRAEVPEELAENWYRTEVLIFVRENTDSRRAEQWDPLPKLEYPATHRYFIDPAVADRRLEESQSYASTIDTRGVQTLLVPEPVKEILDHSRPDWLITPAVDIDLRPAETAGNETRTDGILPQGASTLTAIEGPQSSTQDPNDPAQAPNDPAIDLESPIIALPYQLLDNRQLEFRPQARALRRQGHRIVFHESWWAMLDEAEQTPALIVDRSGDMDSLDWPALQGSLQIYRSRYLHIALDLWLNTQATYLPDGWQIDAPPLSRPSLIAKTLRETAINPWSPEERREHTLLPDIVVDTNAAPGSFPGAKPAGPQTMDEAAENPDYPWRHAIVHRQSRRMRSNEVHYLDHPVLGVIVKITAMSDDELPLLPPTQRAFRERHTLPVTRLPAKPQTDQGGP